jgi:hypothetical protein
MEIENGQIIIETRVDAKEYIDSRIEKLLGLKEDMDAIKATYDSTLAEIQELQK